MDAWIAWLSRNGKWRFGISGKNLTDEEYLTNGYNIPVLGVVQGSYGTPRTFIATVEFRSSDDICQGCAARGAPVLSFLLDIAPRWLGGRNARHAAQRDPRLELIRRRKSHDRNRTQRDKVVIVTGAAAGIGRGTAERFAEEGCKVAAWDVNDEAPMSSSPSSRPGGEASFRR